MTVQELVDVLCDPGNRIESTMNVYFRDNKGQLKDLEVNDIIVCDDEVILIGDLTYCHHGLRLVPPIRARNQPRMSTRSRLPVAMTIRKLQNRIQ